VPNYTYATLQNALDAVAARLYDPTYQFWTATELTYYIIEALRTWNALSQFWRAPMTFPLAQGQWWYDLNAQPGTIIPYGSVQNDLIAITEYHLLEPATTTYPLTWTGTKQYALSDILGALDRREDEQLSETICTLTRLTVTAPLGGPILLPDSTMDVVRIAWLPSGGGYAARPLRQAGMFGLRAFSQGWTTAPSGPPDMWMQNTEPPPSFEVNAVPPVTGQYDILATFSDPASWTTALNATIRLPTDWAWVMKWGALYDLFSREYGAKDVPRATYCLARYREGLALLRKTSCVLALFINNVPFAVDAVRNADDFNPLWQAAAQGPPQGAYLAGNMLAIYPQPDTGAYTVMVDVVENAPVPATTGDYIQVARDDYDTVLDYAQHLAMLKAGGAEFLASVQLYQKMQEKAALYNGKLREMGFFEMTQQDISTLEDMRRPRYQKGSEPKIPTAQ
jgi:hypothetical protein